MTSININDAKKDLYKLARSCIKNKDVVKITTDEGVAIMIDENYFNSMIESLYLAGVKGVYNSVDKVNKTPTSDFNKNAPWN